MYEGMTMNYINKRIEKDIEASAQQKLQVHEILDELLAQYYDLETETETWPENVQNEAIHNWVKNLDLITGSLQQVAVQQLKEQLEPESQNAIETAISMQPAAAATVEGFDCKELEG